MSETFIHENKRVLLYFMIFIELSDLVRVHTSSIGGPEAILEEFPNLTRVAALFAIRLVVGLLQILWP